jgi:hypothetical protein
MQQQQQPLICVEMTEREAEAVLAALTVAKGRMRSPNAIKVEYQISSILESVAAARLASVVTAKTEALKEVAEKVNVRALEREAVPPPENGRLYNFTQEQLKPTVKRRRRKAKPNPNPTLPLFADIPEANFG